MSPTRFISRSGHPRDEYLTPRLRLEGFSGIPCPLPSRGAPDERR